MAHIDVQPRPAAAGVGLLWRNNAPRRGNEWCNAGVAHIVDAEEDTARLMSDWLAATGIEARVYSCLQLYLESPPSEAPECLIVEAGSLDAETLPAGVRCPVIVTACTADVAMAVRIMKTGALDFLEKPLREADILIALCTAIEADRKRRIAESKQYALRARFDTLSRREREVMALVTLGKLNKQVAGDLGLSEITVKAHRGAAMRKMQARSIADLVRMADALEALSCVRSDCSPPARTAAA